MASAPWQNLTADGPELFDMSVFLSGIVRERVLKEYRALSRSTYSTPSSMQLAAQTVEVDAELAGGEPVARLPPPWQPFACDRSTAHAASARATTTTPSSSAHTTSPG